MNLSHLISPARERTCVYTKKLQTTRQLHPCVQKLNRNWNFPEYVFEMLDVCESQDWGHSKSELWYPIFVAKMIDFLGLTSLI